jgi:methionine-rich copper-binding protein CopC
MRRLAPLCIVPTLLLGCATGGTGGRDAGPVGPDARAGIDAAAPDARVALDAAPGPDAGLEAPDATLEIDAAMAMPDAAGPGLDAFTPIDAFTARDAFVPPDAYAPPDAFVPPDAWVAPDAAPPCSGQLDCTACTGGHCVSGACSATNPTTLAYDFEAGVPLGWTNGMGGTAPWTIDTTMPHGGARSLRSGAIGHDRQTRVGFSLTLASAASLSFWMRTSTESCCDEGELWVDGAMRVQRAGTTSWTQLAVDLAPGFHSLEFRYTKDGSIASGSDAVWVDDVVLGPPSDPSTGFESTTLPAGYTTTGAASWSSVTTMPHGGSRCAASGAISDSETSTLARAVTLTADQTLTFWYRTSTENNYDWLEVWIDGTRRDRWSGTTAWTMASYPLVAGAHSVEWRYTKDASATGGSDTVWIDDVSFGPPPTSGPLCGP